jgi:hypothetical protein
VSQPETVAVHRRYEISCTGQFCPWRASSDTIPGAMILSEHHRMLHRRHITVVTEPELGTVITLREPI